MVTVPETAPGRPRGASGAGSRKAILDSAIRVLAREGTHGARVEEIAAEAGVSLGLLNYHFGNRRSLLRVALIAGLEQRPSFAGASLEEMLTSALRASERGATGWWRIRQEALRIAAFDPELRSAATETTAAWTEEISAHLPDGHSTSAMAGLIVALVDGLSQRVSSGIVSVRAAEHLLEEALSHLLGGE